ncbi:MAG: electron transfer flavoprotein subunit alpha/FixB family protein [Kordiimonadaceae bacterium]|jgi:electron transfer flavoprotein alpha subunit|nr:electron transfer flavoprotein subunit alpha/FixB family protein [Kordiimonadaceae bacterium]MDC0082512.1 FAD-binding protein [Emcibacteraceae bacterium]MBT6135761.1 electron transfer flavoprotein subunit alpha/FixB family protein [Kordiimonadaceae bacterium]MBT7606058.1 electron transfer flavoprotein subunit alpha/FixB family protein [Kordiimonadaceae bacterium]MDC0111550.1 FAD-binding protein [Emcibacteraceae bacterium]|tara:strand:+ start:13195 stop:14127 length:933 start_codon:yes stop_codon:yes gene_type:complete
MTVLVIADHDNEKLKDSTLNTVTAATKFNSEIHVLVAGYNCALVANAAAKINGVDKVICADDISLKHPLAEAVTPVVVNLAGKYDQIMVAATTTGKNFMPRVAAILDMAQISDIISIENGNTFKRPIYAGNAIATVESNDTKKLITVRTTTFAAALTGDQSVVIENISIDSNQSLSSFVSSELSKSERPELTSAKIIISGGRGMGSGENFSLIEGIADKLGAAIGASRAAVDAGYVPNDYQVGQTGKIVAPDLYIAVGISGAIQHLAGMKDSKVIVAINKDDDAPIFQVADYGLVADLFEVLPELNKELS